MFSLIVATDINNGIGRNNSIPWRHNEDMRKFKLLTQGNVVVMGRRTWESLPVRPLSNRVNIIISTTLKDSDFRDGKEDVVVFPSIDQMIRFRRGLPFGDKWYNKEWFIIGGATLYNYFLTNQIFLEFIYRTRINTDYNCDTFLKKEPDDSAMSGWKTILLKEWNDATYFEMEKKKNNQT
jgi:dihydrofolate reductase